MQELEAEIKKPENFGTKYLNVLTEPNYIRDIHLVKKSFEKIRMIGNLELAEGGENYLIGVHRFNNLTVLSSFVVKDEQ